MTDIRSDRFWFSSNRYNPASSWIDLQWIVLMDSCSLVNSTTAFMIQHFVFRSIFIFVEILISKENFRFSSGFFPLPVFTDEFHKFCENRIGADLWFVWYKHAVSPGLGSQHVVGSNLSTSRFYCVFRDFIHFPKLSSKGFFPKILDRTFLFSEKFFSST